jgi:hypothetical protein
MSIDRSDVGRATVFALLIALGGGLTAESAGQTTQQPPPQPTASGGAPPSEKAPVDPVTGKPMSPAAAPASTEYPGGVMLKPDATAPAPGVAAGQPTPVRFSGKVGPAGKVIGQNAASSPDGPARITDPAIERLGPGGTGGKAPVNERLGPGGTVGQTSASQPLGPGAPTSSQPAKKASPPAKPEGQQPAKKSGVSSDSGQVANEPVAKRGFQVFVDPATGEITQPTDAQLQELDQQNQAANVLFGPSEVVERPSLVGVGGGMVADVPASLFPVVTAAIGADGKVTLQERAHAGAKGAIASTPKDRQQPLRFQAAQGAGSAENPHVGFELPTTAEVTVAIVNGDAAGEGFNDPTAVAPVFGNPGTTRGAQRLNAFRAAAAYWGAILKSRITIRVDAQMDPQFCTASSAVLGSAGPITVHRDYAGAPVASTWYVQATANSRAGADLDPGQSDIGATFNSDIDNPTCLGGTSWWYGIGAPAPAGTIDFYTVVLHEIGHGIGFLSLVSLGTGAKFGGFDDAYERWLWDWSTGGWPAMSNAQRLASAVNTGQVIFWGPRATEAGRGFLSAGLNGNYPRVFAPNPVQGGSSISHFDTVLAPNELMEPAITAPPGPYAYLTSGALEDIGWKLLANGVFDYGGLGTWTWNPTDGWNQPTTADPLNLEPWNGNFVGAYPSGTWLWNGTTQSWDQLTPAIPTDLKACGNNLLWSSGAYGTWRWSTSTGWDQLTTANPDSLDCFGGDMAWEGASGTWLYDFNTSGGPGTGGWRQITGANPTAIMPCGSRLVWWRAGGAAGDTWFWDTATGWNNLTIGPESTACYRGQLAWEGAAGPGTWLYNFTTPAWSQITGANPDQMLSWGPNLVWENGSAGTWIWNGAAWSQITSADATHVEVLGADLLWAFGGGTWVWSGGGAGTGWTNITGAVPSEIVSTGQVK